MITKLFRSTLMGLFLVSLSLSVVGQSKKGTLDKETFMNMESVAGPAISPDGKQIVFTRSWVDKVKDERASNLWIIDADGDRVRELTTGNWRDSQPVWSPDGKRIAFMSDRDGTTQLHVLWVDTRRSLAPILEQAPSSSNCRPMANGSPSPPLKQTTTRSSRSSCPSARVMRSGRDPQY